MTEPQELKYVDVELTGSHTHAGKPYGTGDVLRLRADQAARLDKNDRCKPAGAKAKPLNVDKNGNLI